MDFQIVQALLGTTFAVVWALIGTMIVGDSLAEARRARYRRSEGENPVRGPHFPA